MTNSRDHSPEILSPSKPSRKIRELSTPSAATCSSSSADIKLFPCRYPSAPCHYVAANTADYVSHIEKIHWHHVDGGSGDADPAMDVYRGKSSERSSNSGDLGENGHYGKGQSSNQATDLGTKLHDDTDLQMADALSYCPFNCNKSIPGGPRGMEDHIRDFHAEDGLDSPEPTPRRNFAKTVNVDKLAPPPLKRATSPGSSQGSEKTKNKLLKQEHRKGRDKSEEDGDYDPGVGTVSPPKTRTSRYAGILRGKTGPDTSEEAERRARQRELTEKIRRILIRSTPPRGDMENDASDSDSEDSFSDDPMQKLRSIASILSSYIYEINNNDMGYTKSGSGYCISYLERLQSLVDDSAEGNLIITQVEEIVRLMDDSSVEYQKPEPTLLELIKKAASNGKTPPELLMCSHAGFYGKDLGDAGWGCGYRNAQMLISTLLSWPVVSDHLKEELGCDSVPNITKLQQLIHRAWERGFDDAAALELDYEVTETSKWIGTTEIFALFSSMKIECLIKDFANGSGDLQTELFRFVHNYFKDSLKNGFAVPLYIQYSGHSRTVIGCDVTGLANPDDPKLMRNVGLLIFDPGQSQWDIEIQGSPTRQWYKKHIYCPMTSFKENTFQILYFTGKVLSNTEYERMKMAGAGHDSSRFSE